MTCALLNPGALQATKLALTCRLPSPITLSPHTYFLRSNTVTLFPTGLIREFPSGLKFKFPHR